MSLSLDYDNSSTYFMHQLKSFHSWYVKDYSGCHTKYTKVIIFLTKKYFAIHTHICSKLLSYIHIAHDLQYPCLKFLDIKIWRISNIWLHVPHLQVYCSWFVPFDLL